MASAPAARLGLGPRAPPQHSDSTTKAPAAQSRFDRLKRIRPSDDEWMDDGIAEIGAAPPAESIAADAIQPRRSLFRAPVARRMIDRAGGAAPRTCSGFALRQGLSLRGVQVRRDRPADAGGAGLRV